MGWDYTAHDAHLRGGWGELEKLVLLVDRVHEDDELDALVEVVEGGGDGHDATQHAHHLAEGESHGQEPGESIGRVAPDRNGVSQLANVRGLHARGGVGTRAKGP